MRAIGKHFSAFTQLMFLLVAVLMCCQSCQSPSSEKSEQLNLSAEDLLGNPDYMAISFGAYRQNTRDIQPSIEELQQDLLLIEALGFKFIRTYNVHFPQAENILKAIKALKDDDPTFEMYVMLGAWINCKGAFTAEPDHTVQDTTANQWEINEAIRLTKAYPDIVKVLAVGNEAMVHWAGSYFVEPSVILGWVNHLQDLKSQGELPKKLWITSSDNFASWGGGGSSYHKPDLEALIKAVDFISMHTYPMHDTHYNPQFWFLSEEEQSLDTLTRVNILMDRAFEYAVSQYESVERYLDSLGIEKPIHIGETGWASESNGFYGSEGSCATDEYKQKLYYQKIRKWTNENGISCFFFEAFDEVWKDKMNPEGSENHFGLFTLDRKAKFAIWEAVDKGLFDRKSTGADSVKKTYGGRQDSLLKKLSLPTK